MGIRVETKSYQNKDIEGVPAFSTMELQNYIYMVVEPRFEDLNPTQPWADAEWKERLKGIRGIPVNPGEAYKLRPEVWEQFLVPCPCGSDRCPRRFDYSYAERLDAAGVLDVIDRIKTDPESRQLYITIWNPQDTDYIGGKRRVPCSLGYQFMIREGALHMTYLMRSSDFYTHFQNDLYLALKLQTYVAEQTGYPVGRFTHFMGSLHIYQKDIEQVF